ncbi:MAG: sugar transferase [Aliidongia sp.]
MLKFVEDRVIGTLILLMVTPVMLAVALAIRLDSPGPIFFRQRRHGFNNAEIEVLKFRTMYHGKGDQTGWPADLSATTPASPGSAPSSGGSASTNCRS